MQIKIHEKCDRCPRIEETAVSLEEAVARSKSPEPRQDALVIAIDGEVVARYSRLCEECRGIVSGYCEGTREQRKKSSRRFKRVVAEASAPPARSARHA